MSFESAKLFIEKMITDEDFAKGVTGCKDSESRKKFIMAKGFNLLVESS